MNTVQIGNDFEKKSYSLILKALNNKELSLVPEHCKIFKKKKYPSFRRKKGIIFDLAIEVTPPKADKATLLYLIECKNYSSSIPVDDINVFASYIDEIEGYAKKGIFITNSKLQSGALEVLKSHGIMLIEVDEDDYNIVHYKHNLIKQDNIDIEDLDSILIKAIEIAIVPNKIEGLRKLSRYQIDSIASSFIASFNADVVKDYLSTPLNQAINFLKEKHGLEVDYKNIVDARGEEILGYYDVAINKIYINNTLVDTPRLPFVIAHEIGHFILHRNLKIHKTKYNNFKDVHFNFFQQSYSLTNPKNWIEWQANCFASCLLMPKEAILLRLVIIQHQLGISKSGKIYLDSQPCNIFAYREILNKLSEHFKVAKISVEYRLNDLGLVIRALDDDLHKEYIREHSLRRNYDY